MAIRSRPFRRMPIRAPIPEASFFMPKPVSGARLGAFWKNYFAGKLVRKPISSKHRLIIAVTPSVLGTVRNFYSTRDARAYARAAKETARRMNALRPEKFTFFPTQILAMKSNVVLERVYPAPSCCDILTMSRESRYLKGFLDSIKGKGLEPNEFSKIVSAAYDEMKGLQMREWIEFDSHDSNILVLDYNPKTRKVAFMAVDFVHGH